MRIVLPLLVCVIIIITLIMMRYAKSDTKWETFKSNNISADGRVIDWQNKQISHSEGQGYGLLAAVYFDDRVMFDKILAWSENNLGNGLKAWKWGLNGTSWEILDRNNAADGDLLHAWGLFKAGEKWKNDVYTAKAKKILELLKKTCIKDNGIILPGREGFVHEGVITVNPSYYVFPALEDFIKFDSANTDLWKKTIDTGLKLIKEVNPSNGLPSDWLLIHKDGVITPKNNYVFGYEAIRIPLYLSAYDSVEGLEMFKQLIRKVATEKYMHACVSDNKVKGCAEEAGYGFYAILVKTATDLHMNDEAKIINSLYKLKSKDNRRYYDSVLSLLADIL